MNEARAVRKLLEDPGEEFPAVNRRAEVTHVLDEDVVEIVQSFEPMPRGHESHLLRFPDLVPDLGVQAAPRRLGFGGELEHDGDFVVLRGQAEAARLALAKIQPVRPELIAQAQRSRVQRGGGLVASGANAAGIHERQ